MPFENYDVLQQSIAGWLARTDLEQRIPDFIRLAEVKFFNDLDLRTLEDEVRLDTKIPAGENPWPFPPDAGEIRFFRINTSPPRVLEIVSLSKISDARYHNKSSFPAAAAVVGRSLEFDVPSVEENDITVWYYPSTMGYLTENNTTNGVLERRPDLYLYGSLLQAAPYVGADQRVAVWGSFYEAAVSTERALQFRRRLGGGKLRVRPDVIDAAQPTGDDTWGL